MQVGLIWQSRAGLLLQTALNAGTSSEVNEQALLRYAARLARRVEIGRSVYS